MTASLHIGYFESEEKILAATRDARESGLSIRDVFTPYAVHGLDEAMGIAPSRLTWVCFAAGLLGASGALALQYYTSVVSWPLNVGGKPFNSFPAFIPVAFELTVLAAGLTTVAAFLFRAKLFPGSRKLALEGVTNDRFALALETSDAQAAQRVFKHHGARATEVREVPS